MGSEDESLVSKYKNFCSFTFLNMDRQSIEKEFEKLHAFAQCKPQFCGVSEDKYDSKILTEFTESLDQLSWYLCFLLMFYFIKVWNC